MLILVSFGGPWSSSTLRGARTALLPAQCSLSSIEGAQLLLMTTREIHLVICLLWLARSEQLSYQKRIFRTGIFLLFFIVGLNALNSARREEANDVPVFVRREDIICLVPVFVRSALYKQTIPLGADIPGSQPTRTQTPFGGADKRKMSPRPIWLCAMITNTNIKLAVS
jgi:hypothetical protein